MFRTIEELRLSLDATGLPRAAVDTLSAYTLRGVALEPRIEASGSEPAPGGSRIGGLPDLPVGVAWPVRPAYADAPEQMRRQLDALERWKDSGRASPGGAAARTPKPEDVDAESAAAHRLGIPFPLTFVAQVDLAAVAAAGPVDPDVPRRGHLLVFYDVERQPSDIFGWGRGMSRLLHVDDGEGPLVRRPEPPDLASAGLGLRPVVCAHEGVVMPLALNDGTLATILPDASHRVVYQRWRTQAVRRRRDHGQVDLHLVGGHASAVQNDGRETAERARRGSVATLSGMETGPGPGLLEALSDWVHVVQIASYGLSSARGMSWGDAGCLNVWLHRADLCSARYDRAWFEIQSG